MKKIKRICTALESADEEAEHAAFLAKLVIIVVVLAAFGLANALLNSLSALLRA